MNLIDGLILIGVFIIILTIIISKFKNRNSNQKMSQCSGCSFAKTCKKRNKEK